MNKPTPEEFATAAKVLRYEQEWFLKRVAGWSLWDTLRYWRKIRFTNELVTHLIERWR